MAMALQLRPKCMIYRSPSFIHRLSSSSSSDNNGGEDKNDPQSPPSPMSSSFSDVRASLRKSPPSPSRRLSQTPIQDNPSFSSSNPTQVSSLKDISKFLSQYRRNPDSPLPGNNFPPSSPKSSKSVSFQEIYNRNIIEKSEERSKTGGSVTDGRPVFDEIRQSLRKMKNQNQGDKSSEGPDRMGLNPFSLKRFNDDLKMKPDNLRGRSSSVVMGGSETVSPDIFKSELTRTDVGPSVSSSEFLKAYNYGELGAKLRQLRPAEIKGSKNWFSFTELNERLKKLRESEEKLLESRSDSRFFKDIRESLVSMRDDSKEKEKKNKQSFQLQRLDILASLGGTPRYSQLPPKEHLVEKYFHPDNMSSAEKLKLELKKIRDEFKLSESDCGSSRVQVAQLTVKIKHLSSVLHKKDTHSRKGLQEMVQRRKKLLRYLRRTDWDSYCLCLSKLGLRDNPDYKN